MVQNHIENEMIQVDADFRGQSIRDNHTYNHTYNYSYISTPTGTEVMYVKGVVGGISGMVHTR